MEYDFELAFKLARDDEDTDELIGRLGEAGCDDSTVGIGVPGQIGLMFIRDAASAEQAIINAIADVRRAIPDAELIEVGPDLVGLTDIAKLVGVSRQNMRKLMVNHAATFPSPVHGGTTTIWHLALVLEWLVARDYSIAQPLRDVARMAMQINLFKELQYLEQPVQSRIQALVVHPKRKAGAKRAAYNAA
jgi:hypothetical protein